MHSNQQAYAHAEKIDKQIIQLAEDYPMTGDNARQWLLFARTLRTTLDCIEHEAMAKLGLKYPQTPGRGA